MQCILNFLFSGKIKVLIFQQVFLLALKRSCTFIASKSNFIQPIN